MIRNHRILLTLPTILLLFCFQMLTGQKQHLSEEDLTHWNQIKNTQLSATGEWVMYMLSPNKGDSTLKLYNQKTGGEMHFDRAIKPSFDYDGNWLFFMRTTDADSIKTLKRKKLKKKDMPHDTLVIVNLKTGIVSHTPHVQSYKLPAKKSNAVAFLLEADTWSPVDSTQSSIKKQTKDNGSDLILHNLIEARSDTINYVTKYSIASEKAVVLAHTTGSQDSLQSLIRYDIEQMTSDTIHTQKGKYEQWSLNTDASKICYIADFDTTEAQIRPHEIFLWQEGTTSKKLNYTLQENLKISEHYTPYFSENNQVLYFGVAPPPIVQDTTLLKEEIVEVEVWSYHDPKLFTQQESEISERKKQHYTVSYHIEKDLYQMLNDAYTPNIILANKGNAPYAISTHTESYEQYISWLGYAFRDIYKIDVASGKKTTIAKKIQANIKISPTGKYVYWYSRPDSSWNAYDLAMDTHIVLTDHKTLATYNEHNDRPIEARSYGIAGWTENDKSIVLYDRYDMIEVPMKNPQNFIKWTDGRKDKIRYRYNAMDTELEYISSDTTLLLSIFDEKDKSSGYAQLATASKSSQILVKGPYRYDTSPLKARLTNDVVITKESFELFPNLLLTDINLTNPIQISDANPQQQEYSWGNAELYSWQDEDGNTVEGLLIKPDGFDPNKSYPLMVNFYERSSHNLHRHRAPNPHRSTINYSMYVNKGYVIFNPDIWYTNGHPGESCRKAVVSGVESLLELGYINAKKIGIQGHSWGGYQIAYLLSKTDIFACAEAGAPVVNMTSAYGGIRWRSGMSRMFQYERTQSRIGHTLWEAPELYIENSPIFDIPKVNTPVLILHNDKDGAVPWYQGIEYFVALRRLGKPAWMLNYNGEPHWPLKWQNRMDFQKRMAQFFDHYLLDKPSPSWMKNGLDAIEKGVNQGYEYDE